jgi:hypothetical protein
MTAAAATVRRMEQVQSMGPCHLSIDVLQNSRVLLELSDGTVVQPASGTALEVNQVHIITPFELKDLMIDLEHDDESYLQPYTCSLIPSLGIGQTLSEYPKMMSEGMIDGLITQVQTHIRSWAKADQRGTDHWDRKTCPVILDGKRYICEIQFIQSDKD